MNFKASGMKILCLATSSPPDNDIIPVGLNNTHQTFTDTTFDTHHYNSNAIDMSGRVLFARVVPLARRRLYNARPVTRRSPYPLGAYSLHNIPVTRPISFVRVLPKLVQKFAVLGAAGAGATVAGLVYIQNQATAAGNW